MRLWAIILIASSIGLSAACALLQSAPERPQCSEDTLASIVFDCRAQRDDRCKDAAGNAVPYEQCEFLGECDKRIEEWEKCQ